MKYNLIFSKGESRNYIPLLRMHGKIVEIFEDKQGDKYALILGGDFIKIFIHTENGTVNLDNIKKKDIKVIDDYVKKNISKFSDNFECEEWITNELSTKKNSRFKKEFLHSVVQFLEENKNCLDDTRPMLNKLFSKINIRVIGNYNNSNFLASKSGVDLLSDIRLKSIYGIKSRMLGEDFCFVDSDEGYYFLEKDNKDIYEVSNLEKLVAELYLRDSEKYSEVLEYIESKY